MAHKEEYKFSSDEELLTTLKDIEPNIHSIVMSNNDNIAVEIRLSETMFISDDNREILNLNFDNIEHLIHSINEETNKGILIKKEAGANEGYYSLNTYSLIEIK